MQPVHRLVDLRTRQEGLLERPTAAIQDQIRYVLRAEQQTLLFAPEDVEVGEGGRIPLRLELPAALRGATRVVLLPRLRFPKRWRTHPRKVEPVESDGVREFVRSELRLPEIPAGTKLRVTAIAYLPPEAAERSWETPEISLPDACRLEFGIGILEFAWDQGPVRFAVQVCESGSCIEVFSETLDPSHPGVAKVNALGDTLLGGRIALAAELSSPFPNYTLWPIETRVLFKEKGWRTVVAFQTRNPPHLGHEYVQKTALTFTDGLFINPIIGKKKQGDFTDEVIIKTYHELIDRYYLRDRAVMGILQAEMRYAGPREAILHAIMRKNFGCTHFIVGRDHAGVGSFYGPYDAQKIFDEFPDLGILPLFFKSFFYCKKCSTVTNEKSCPHGKKDRINFSGTKIRKLLSEGESPQKELMRQEVAEVIMQHPNPFVE